MLYTRIIRSDGAKRIVAHNARLLDLAGAFLAVLLLNGALIIYGGSSIENGATNYGCYDVRVKYWICIR